MPILDKWLNNQINELLIRDNEERNALHEPSGKLSASMLYQPLRFQVLKTIGAPRKPLDPYVLGKFKRGNDVEDWLVDMINQTGVLKETQKQVEYKGVVGYADGVIDTDQMESKKGVIPLEIKSVTNAKLRQIKKTGIDYHYKLQATLYALAMGTDHYGLCVISAEDLQPSFNIFQTSELKHEVHEIIEKYNKAMEAWEKDRVLPVFKPNPKVAWTANLQYSMFEPEWATESDTWAIAKLKALGIIDQNEKTKESPLKPYNAIIQVCPYCSKIDVYKDDNHFCDREYQNHRRESEEHLWK